MLFVVYKAADPTRRTINCSWNATNLPHPSTSPLKCHLLLDLSNCQCGVESLRACAWAVQNGMASVQAHWVVKNGLSFLFSSRESASRPRYSSEFTRLNSRHTKCIHRDHRASFCLPYSEEILFPKKELVVIISTTKDNLFLPPSCFAAGIAWLTCIACRTVSNPAQILDNVGMR